MAISLTVDYSRNVIRANLFSYDLKVEVKAATGMPEEIFIFQRKVPPAENPSLIEDNFVCIADPVDLDEVPVGSPDMANEMPYYRAKVVTMRFRDMEELAETLNLVKEDIAKLVESLKAAEDIELIEEVVYA